MLAGYRRFHNGSVGFVPTMGALHHGHLSLLTSSIRKNDQTYCSIFVNPSQFDNQQDLERYPNTIESDLNALIDLGVDVVYLPPVEEVYPHGDHQNVYDLSGLDVAIEGASRPGHFQGVANVLDRFFRLVQPTRAYFGQKDYQQTLVVKRLVEILKLPTSIEVCPIVREENGLAMSSRNAHLSKEEKQEASIIRKTLLWIEREFKRNPHHLQKIIDDAKKQINDHPFFQVDYLLAADAQTLVEFEQGPFPDQLVLLTVVACGPVRLLDNHLIHTDRK